jgi:hypothetical protein
MDRKEAISHLRAVKAIVKAAGKAKEPNDRTIEALDVAISSIEKLEELQVWLKDQEAALLAEQRKEV